MPIGRVSSLPQLLAMIGVLLLTVVYLAVDKKLREAAPEPAPSIEARHRGAGLDDPRRDGSSYDVDPMLAAAIAGGAVFTVTGGVFFLVFGRSRKGAPIDLDALDQDA